MANTTSAKKATRQIARRTEVNKDRLSRIRTFIKRVELAIEKKQKKEAKDALQKAESEIMRGVSKGVVKLNTASRKVSRLSARIKAIS